MSRIRRIIMFPVTRLVIFAVMTIVVWVLLRLRPGLGSLTDSEFYHKQVTLMIAPVVAGVLLVLLVERRPFSATGFGSAGLGRALVSGLTMGAGAMALTAVIMAALGNYRVGSLAEGGSGLWTGLGAGFAYYVGVAVAEEALMRGTLLRLVEEWLGSWAALLIIAFVFGWYHVAGDTRERLFLGVIGGVFYGACYLLARNLWMPIGAHLAWNFAQGNVLGFAVSGGAVRVTVIDPVLSGSDLWTGGAFGAEGSVIALAVCAVISVGLLYAAVRRGRIVPPAWVQTRRSREGKAA